MDLFSSILTIAAELRQLVSYHLFVCGQLNFKVPPKILFSSVCRLLRIVDFPNEIRKRKERSRDLLCQEFHDRSTLSEEFRIRLGTRSDGLVQSLDSRKNLLLGALALTRTELPEEFEVLLDRFPKHTRFEFDPSKNGCCKRYAYKYVVLLLRIKSLHQRKLVQLVQRMRDAESIATGPEKHSLDRYFRDKNPPTREQDKNPLGTRR